MEKYRIYVEREDDKTSVAYTPEKNGEIVLDTSVADCGELNPAEVLLSSFGGCLLKNITKIVEEKMHTRIFCANVDITGIRKDNPTQIIDIEYNLSLLTNKIVNTTRLLELLEKYGTVYNTLKRAVNIKGKIQVEVSKEGGNDV